MKKAAKIAAKELEERFDKGEDVLQFFDTTKAELEEPKTQRVNVDFPEWMVRELDDEASRLGVSRQSIIKLLLSTAFARRTTAWQTASAIHRPLATYLDDAVEERVASGPHEAPEVKKVIEVLKVLQEAFRRFSHEVYEKKSRATSEELLR